MDALHKGLLEQVDNFNGRFTFTALRRDDIMTLEDNVIDLDELYDDNIESIKEQEEANDKMVGGIKHPPISGKYMAMSLYTTSMDDLHSLL